MESFAATMPVLCCQCQETDTSLSVLWAIKVVPESQTKAKADDTWRNSCIPERNMENKS